MRTTLAVSALSRWHVAFLRLGVGLCGLALAWFLIQEPRIGSLLAVSVIALLLGIALFFGRDGILSFKRMLVPLLAVAILFPSIRMPAGIPAVRLELIIVLAAWGLLFLGYLTTGHPIRVRRCPAYKWFLLFGLCILVSMVHAALGKGHPVIGQDFWELAKLLQFFLTFALVASLRISPANIRRYYKLALVLLLLSALFGFLQYVDFASVNQIVSPYYAPTQMQGLIVQRRIIGTTSNPNQFGALMVLAASLALSGGLFLQERRLRILCWGLLPVFWLALALTLSRSALVALVLAGVTVLFLFLRQKGLKRRLRRVLGLVLFGCVVGALILQVMPEEALFRFGELPAFSEASSWQARIKIWEDHLGLWMLSPLFGWGPGKTIISTNVDNEWLLLLTRYGLAGLVVFLILAFSLYRGLSRIRHNSEREEIRALAVALQATFVAYAAFMFPAGVYHDLQLMPICMVLLGLAYTQMKGPTRQ